MDNSARDMGAGRARSSQQKLSKYTGLADFCGAEDFSEGTTSSFIAAMMNTYPGVLTPSRCSQTPQSIEKAVFQPCQANLRQPLDQPPASSKLRGPQPHARASTDNSGIEIYLPSQAHPEGATATKIDPIQTAKDSATFISIFVGH